jgi:recombination protein RecR
VKLPNPLEDVVNAFRKLPGIGSKSAQRMVLCLLKEGPYAMEKMGILLQKAATSIVFCETCGGFSDNRICSICTDQSRDASLLLVVAEASNIPTFERSGHFRGHYHVLGGLISPLKGVGPDTLKVKELLKRLEKSHITEVILATNPTLDGEATAVWLARILESIGLDLKISRIGLGLPIGSDLEYADDLTLDRAMDGRRSL